MSGKFTKKYDLTPQTAFYCPGNWEDYLFFCQLYGIYRDQIKPCSLIIFQITVLLHSLIIVFFTQTLFEITIFARV